MTHHIILLVHILTDVGRLESVNDISVGMKIAKLSDYNDGDSCACLFKNVNVWLGRP